MEIITAALLSWYDRCARTLPWRGFHDAYRTWVSEAMLQQTRVETVLAYYSGFLVRFPNIFSLAEAREKYDYVYVVAGWQLHDYGSRALQHWEVVSKVSSRYYQYGN